VARKPTKRPIKSKRQRFTPEYKLEAVRQQQDNPYTTGFPGAQRDWPGPTCSGSNPVGAPKKTLML
jgi:hypothetical protein